jgi:TolB-like protein/Tfp pilus assembly protein PilF
VSGEKGVGLKGWLSGPRRSGAGEEASVQALDRHRIAVLPFSNVSPDPQDEYFADGMTDEFISTVSKIDGLEVISRTSIMHYKKNARLVKDVSQTLGVGSILEGSVRKAGNKLRVTVQLIDAVRDKHVWSNSYDREIRDIFAIQSDIAESVADALKLQLLGERRDEIRKRTADNADAYSLYLKGRFYWNERNPESVRKAIQYFESAVGKDPKFALPYVGLADCYLIEMDQALLDAKDAVGKTKSLLDTALGIDGRLAEAHASLGILHDQSWNWAAARTEHRRALELNRNYAMAHHWYSIHLSFTDRPEESLDEIRTALRLDPISPIVNMNYGLRLAESGSIQEGIVQLKKTLGLEPGFGLAHAHLGQVYVSQSEFDKGIYEMNIALELMQGNSWSRAMLGYAYALKGEREKAQGFLADLEMLRRTAYVPEALLGAVNFVLGDKEKAFSLIGQGIEQRSSVIPYMRIFPLFKIIREDPRFMTLLDKMLSV